MIENIKPLQKNWLYVYPDLHLWYQPLLQLGDISTIDQKKEGFGGALRLHFYLNLPLNRTTMNIPEIYLCTGYKTRGYLQGEALDERIIFRAGLYFKY